MPRIIISLLKQSQYILLTLGGGNNAEGVDDPVRLYLSNLGENQGSHFQTLFLLPENGLVGNPAESYSALPPSV